MTAITESYDLSTKNDLFYDFCLWQYEPLSAPENKFRSVNLLLNSFDYANVNVRLFELVSAIREGIGPGKTVWGLKKLGEKIAWEFYFYDYKRIQRERSITRLLEILKPYVRCQITANENLPYFMFSIDITDELASRDSELGEVHMYLGNPGSSVSSGICYSLTGEGTRLENFYFFFDAKKQMDEIVDKIACSAHLDQSQVGLDQILIPELRDCQVIVVANKQQSDGIYFSRITVEQLLFFLNKFRYPEPLRTFVESNMRNLDHLLFDVGFDYRMDGDKLLIIKSGYYGIF